MSSVFGSNVRRVQPSNRNPHALAGPHDAVASRGRGFRKWLQGIDIEGVGLLIQNADFEEPTGWQVSSEGAVRASLDITRQP